MYRNRQGKKWKNQGDIESEWNLEKNSGKAIIEMVCIGVMPREEHSVAKRVMGMEVQETKKRRRI